MAAGLDIGTTSVKLARFDAGGTLLERSERRYDRSDPEAVIAAALGLAPDEPFGLSVAMHSLVGLDARDRPVTPLFTWADPPARAQAERLRREHPELHARTGTPLRGWAPLARLCELRERGVRAHRWVGIKELVVHRLTGEWLTDHSTASGTGLLNLLALDWDGEALLLAGIGAGQLPRLAPVTKRLGDVALGGADGPLANLGLGATGRGVAACSVGTSAALRLTVSEPAVAPGTFCYALTPGRWVTGAALSNGGAVLTWLSATLGRPIEELLALAAAATADGLVFDPHLLAERAHDRPAVLSGLRPGHGPGDITRAALEGIARELRGILDALPAAVTEVRAAGGLMRSRLFREILAAALGVPVDFTHTPEASALGAAMLVGGYDVRPVPPSATAALRAAVLRTGQGIEAVDNPVDDVARFFAAVDPDGEVIATANVRPAAPPWEPDGDDWWQLRGVATAPAHRRRGAGTAVVRAALDHVGRQGGRTWCNARTESLALYRPLGFEPVGEIFDVPGRGPHQALSARPGSPGPLRGGR